MYFKLTALFFFFCSINFRSGFSLKHILQRTFLYLCIKYEGPLISNETMDVQYFVTIHSAFRNFFLKAQGC